MLLYKLRRLQYDIALILMISTGAMSSTIPAKGPHMQVSDHLLRHYGPPFNRPVSDFNKSVDVELLNFIYHIPNFMWYDEYLRWDASDYFSVDEVEIPISKVWYPDITLYYSPDFEFPTDLRVIVSSDGKVKFYFPVVFSVFCRLDVRFFPFDTQRCKLRFGSWIYTGRRVDFLLPTNRNISINYINNGIWDFTLEFHRQVIHYEGYGDNPEIVFTLLLTRRSTFNVLTIIIPCFLLSVINMMVFVLPTESGEKVSLGIANVLALVLFQQLISGILPPTSDKSPLISYYFTPMIITGCLEVLTSAIVANLHQKDEQSHIPNWIGNLVKRCHKKPSFKQNNGNAIHGEANCGMAASDKTLAGYEMKDTVMDEQSDIEYSNAVTYRDVASALNNIMLALCLLITILSATVIILCFIFMYQ